MADSFRKPTVSIGGHKCVSAIVSCSLNSLINVSAVLCSGDTDGSILTPSDIYSLAKKCQEMIFKEPKEGTLTLTLDDGNQGTISYNKLVITSCEVNSSTGGGLSLRISATSPDVFVTLVDPSVYMKSVIETNAHVDVSRGDANRFQDTYWVSRMNKLSDVKSSVSQKILRLVQFAKTKYAARNSNKATKNVLDNQQLINNKYFKYVKDFLSNSDKTTEVLNGNIEVTRLINRAIYNNIHYSVLTNNGNMLEKLLGPIAQDYYLWYIPDLKSGGVGKLRNRDYEGKNVDGTLSLPTSSFTFSIGRSLTQMLAPSMVYVQARTTYDSSRANRNYDKYVSGCYPSNAGDTLGPILNIEAPSWLTLGHSSSQSGGSNTNSSNSSSSGNPLDNPRVSTKTVIKNDKFVKQVETNKKDSGNILETLSKQIYFEAKFSTSVATVSCPAMVNIDAEIGDFLQVNAEGGGKLFSGILSRVQHTFQTGTLSTELGFTRVEL